MPNLSCWRGLPLTIGAASAWHERRECAVGGSEGWRALRPGWPAALRMTRPGLRLGARESKTVEGESTTDD